MRYSQQAIVKAYYLLFFQRKSYLFTMASMFLGVLRCLVNSKTCIPARRPVKSPQPVSQGTLTLGWESVTFMATSLLVPL